MRNLFFTSVCFLFLSCQSSSNQQSPSPNFDSTIASVSTPTIVIEDSIKIKKPKADIDKLKAKFTSKKDEFNPTSFYYHKHWGNNWIHKSTLYTYLNGDGFIFLVSNYYNDDPRSSRCKPAHLEGGIKQVSNMPCKSYIL